MTTDTLAKLAADLEQLASEGPELIHTHSGAYISQKLSEAAKALAAQALPAAGRCDECGKDQAEGWALYCVGCLEKTGLLAKEALPSAQHVSSTAADLTGPNDTAAQATTAAAATGGGVTTGAPSEPFGYFKAQPFGWTDCAETDDGAVALYERPQQAAQATSGWPASLTTAALKQSGATMESAAAHLESLPKMHQGKLLAHDLRRAASCCETALAALPQPQPQSAQTKGDAA